MARLPGRPSIWGGSGEAGSGSRTPRGRERRGAPRGTHKARVVRCQAGSQALGGQHEAAGSHGQLSGLPAVPGQELTPQGAPLSTSSLAASGVGFDATGRDPTSPRALPQHHPLPTGAVPALGTPQRGQAHVHSPPLPSPGQLLQTGGCRQPPPAPAGHPGAIALSAPASRCLLEPHDRRLPGIAPVQRGAPTSPRRIWQAALAARAGAGWSWQPRGQPSSLRCTCTDSAGRARAAPGPAPHSACGPQAPIPAPHGAHIAPVPAPRLSPASPASDPQEHPLRSPDLHGRPSAPPPPQKLCSRQPQRCPPCFAAAP